MDAFTGACNLPSRESLLSAQQHFSGLARSTSRFLTSRTWQRDCEIIDSTFLIQARQSTRDSSWPPLAIPKAAAPTTALLWDGRLDNETELRDTLNIPLQSGEIIGNPSSVALRAYLKWGTPFAAHLLGDFAVAVYDGRNRKVVLARDPFGLRPLYYCFKDMGLWWSTEIRFLLAL